MIDNFKKTKGTAKIGINEKKYHNPLNSSSFKSVLEYLKINRAGITDIIILMSAPLASHCSGCQYKENLSINDSIDKPTIPKKNKKHAIMTIARFFWGIPNMKNGKNKIEDL